MELSGLTRHVPVWHLTVLSLVSFFQVKLTGTFTDHEAPGHPIEATLSGLLCVGHSTSHFVSTVWAYKYFPSQLIITMVLCSFTKFEKQSSTKVA